MDKKWTQRVLYRELTGDDSHVGGTKADSLRELLFAPKAKVEHPCERFARQAGYASWAAALVSMRDGHIVSAPGPRVGRSTLDHDLFAQQIRADGLVSVVYTAESHGLVSVGVRESFSTEIQARLDGGWPRSAAGSVYITDFSRTRKTSSKDGA
ncbi:hypothetical protein [Burkholderia cenocepacia]|uniref:hypothetical protein n=1 Tax=Burkholderia cenocepacia TaxID=95486 RepID=UPI000F593A4E|nr:hypothetical protein [Burkholderia cenocepacia]RQU83917.1 hypothetical protein DF040_33895 [Burkholderia cenocepacia]